MYFGGSFSFQLYLGSFTGFFLIIANNFAVKAIFNRPVLQYPVGYTMRKTAVLTFALVVLTLALIGCAAADSTNDHVIQVSGSGSVTGTRTGCRSILRSRPKTRMSGSHSQTTLLR